MSDPKKLKLKRMIVTLPNDTETTLKEFEQLLSETDLEVDELVECALAEELNEDMLKDATMVVILDNPSETDSDVEDFARKCANTGAPVVVLLGPNTNFEGIHPIADSFGTQCPWTPEQLLNKVSKPLESKPTDRKGTERANSKPKPVPC